MKNWKLGQQIAFGFGLLLLILILLGVTAVWQTKGVQTKANRLPEAYIPEVDISNSLHTTFQRVMYNMRGYAYTHDERFLSEAQRLLDEVVQHLGEAETLAQAQSLTQLQQNTSAMQQRLKEYQQLVKETGTKIQERQRLLPILDTAAQKFMASGTAYLAEQEARVQEYLNRQEELLALATEANRLAAEARVSTLKKAAFADLQAFVQAENYWTEAQAKLDQLATQLPDQHAARTEIEKAQAAAADYMASSARYYEARAQAEASLSSEVSEAPLSRPNSTADLSPLVAEMTRHAQAFITSCTTVQGHLKADLNTAISDSLARLRMANHIIDQGNAVRVANFKAQASQDISLLDDGFTRFPTIYKDHADLLGRTHDAGEQAQLLAVKEAALAYEGAMQKLKTLWLDLNRLDASRNTSADAVLVLAEQTADVGLERMEESTADSVGALARANRILGFGVLGAGLVGGSLGWLITRSITRLICTIIAGLRESSHQVASASMQVAQASQQLAEGASEQAASVEETSSSLEELSSMTQQNAANASTATETMARTGKVVEEANAAMRELIASMDEIAKGSAETQKIIKTIDEIAFQTNLLALNAAVEAARAGSAGAGFAVVADEVRNLAGRAAEAARVTADLIETSVQKIQNGSALASRTNTAFSRVSEGALEAGSLIKQIATASSDQAGGIQQINNAVIEMDRVVQQTASYSEESAAAAEEMQAQAYTLQEHIQELSHLVGLSTHQEGEANEPSLRTRPRLVTKATSISPRSNGSSNGRSSHSPAEKELTFSDVGTS